MFITSSRKPSAKTRTFCKKLSQFMTFRYVNRGKTGLRDLLDLAEGEAFLIVGEYHGNPGSLSFYGTEGKLSFSLRFSEISSEKVSLGFSGKLKLFGRGELAELLAFYLPFDRVEDVSALPAGFRVLIVEENSLDFREGNTSTLKLRPRSFKRYEESDNSDTLLEKSR